MFAPESAGTVQSGRFDDPSHFKQRLRAAKQSVLGGFGAKFKVGQVKSAVVLGSGLGDLVDAFSIVAQLPYSQVEGLPVSTVAGHKGQLLLVEDKRGQQHLIFQGRFHLYEGYSAQETTLPVRLVRALEVPNLILTNAAGGINPNLRVGDLMLITDHINLTGQNPLRGPNDDQWGPRFFDMAGAYHPALCELARQAALAGGVGLKEGVYLSVLGPNYETSAEIRAFATLGADAVGMSTVSEILVAKHQGTPAMAISYIANTYAQRQGSALAATPLTHEEVVEGGKKAAKNLRLVLTGTMERL